MHILPPVILSMFPDGLGGYRSAVPVTSVVLQGFQISSSRGSVGLSTGMSRAISGQSIISSQNVLGLNPSTSQSVNLTGQSTTSYIGTPTRTVTDSVQLTPLAITSSRGTMTTSDIPDLPTISAARLNDTTVRYTFTGGAGATSWTVYYRTPSGSGSYTSQSITVGQSSYDVTVSSGGTCDLYLSATNDAGTVNSSVATGSAASVPSGFQLKAGHFISAKRAPSLVYPRPDAETHADSKHRRHYPGIKYEIPVGVDFGAWPYLYELTVAPAGMSIGQNIWSSNYGVVSWDNPTTGTHTVAGRVIDQDGNIVTFQWSLVITTAKAIFIDPINGNNANNGSINAPFLNNIGWHLGTIATTTYAGYHVYYRGGNHALAGMASNNNNIRIDGFSQHPAAFVAYPGETVNMNCSTGRFFSMTPHSDLFVGGIRFHDGRQDFENAHFFWLAADGISRCTFFRNTFDGLGPGTIGNDNTSCVFVSSTSGIKQNFYYCENTYEDLGSSSNGVSLFDHYYTEHILFERATMRRCNGTYGVWAKSHNNYVCVRKNFAENCSPGTGLMVTTFEDNTAIAEHCWNTLLLNDATNGNAIWDDHEAYNTGRFYAYRNTVVGRIFARSAGGAGTARVADNNIVISPSSQWLTNFTNNSNVNYPSASGVIDSGGALVGSAATTYLGTHGAEIPTSSLAA